MTISLNRIKNAVFGINTGIFFLLLFLYQIVFTFFGIDFSDMGLSAIFYQQIFNNPETVQLTFSIWFTGVVGGIWLMIFPSSGLIGIRVLGVVAFSLMLILVYLLLRNHFHTKKLKIGLALLTILIGPHFAFMGFHYDTASALFLVLVIFLLFKGLTEKNNFFLLLSGFFLCLSSFARIPNIAGIALALPALYYGYLNNYTLGKYFKSVAFFLSGLAIGSAFIFLLMKLLNHDEFFFNSIINTMERGKSGNSHDIFSLLKLYFQQYAEIFIIILAGILLMSAYLLITTKTRYKTLIILPVIIAFALYELILQNDFMRIKEFFIYHGFAFLFSFIVLTDRKLNSEHKFLALLGIFMMILLPLGCNYGFVNMYGLAFTISLPLAVCCFLSIQPGSITIANRRTFIMSPQAISVSRITVFSIMVITALFSSVYYSYCEASKYKLTYSINSNQARGVFTSKERATVVNELLAASSKYLSKDDYVFAYHSIPMFYFLTETKPWLYNIWTATYSPEDIDYFIQKSYSEKKVLPVIVRAKFTTWGNWPHEGLIDTASSKSELDRYLDESLIKENNYNPVWENKAFQILIPPNSTVLR